MDNNIHWIDLCQVDSAIGLPNSYALYLTIIPRVWIGFEAIAREAEGLMGYWLRGHEGERNNCFSEIQLVGQKYRDETTLAS